MEIINSEQNQWLKKLRALKTKKYREEYQQFVVEGSRFCREAILHNISSIEALLVSEKALESPNIKDVLKLYSQKYYIVSTKLLEKNLSTINPQGIAAIINKPRWNLTKLLKSGKLFVVLDGIQDPGNLGTIIRTAFGAGVDAVFCLPGTVDLYNDKSLRSTMGAVFKLPVFYQDDPNKLIMDLKNNDFEIVIADIRASKYHFQPTYPKKLVLVLGSEARGPKLITSGDIKVKIPLDPRAESLNVAVAGAIILYEIVRQRMV
ncbi:MAG: methyltransferase, TrmH family [Clostridia bacterium]|nr:methyltransferase, TrmH family [Clostridia bacterium]